MEIKDRMPKVVDMDKLPEEDKDWLPYDKETLDGLTYGSYIIKNKDGEVIYIGSGFCVDRLWAHAPFYKGRPEETFPDAVSFKITWCDTKKQSEELETKLLEDYKTKHHGELPKHNKKI